MAMDAIAGVKNYLEKIISDPQLEGMKALLLDADTKSVISMVMSQSHILQREVFLVEQLDAAHEPMLHLKAAVFVRPTARNVELLRRELKAPKYGRYHLFFSNILPVEALEKLAEADEKEVVVQIQEYYADYLAVNDSLFDFGLHNSVQLSVKMPAALPGGALLSTATAGVLTTDSVDKTKMTPPQLFQRSVEGLLSVLLSMKKRPAIRYAKGSEVAEKLAREVSARMQLEQDGLFDFRRPEVTPLVYVLDRKDDPVTPLLTQWCYQAMVHELLGLRENRVDLRDAPNVRKDMTELVLSTTSDDFYAQHVHANFGDLGMAVKQLVDKYQAQTQTHENIQSIDDMQRFLENYPAFRSQSVTVSKHVTLMGELARRVEVDGLMDVSQLEQELACGDDHNAHFRDVVAKLKDAQVKPINKLRLAILYALRYETHSSVQLKTVKELLAAPHGGGLSSDRVALIDAFLKFGGQKARQGDLYGDRAGLKKFMRAVTQGVQGVPNVYAQHVPPLAKKLELILKGQLLDQEFGVVNGGAAASSSTDLSGSNGVKRVRDVIVYVCGGVTFEEAMKVAEFNQKAAASNSGQRILLGGSCIHNSTSFLEEVATAYNLSPLHGHGGANGNWNYDGKKL
ncbi:Vacuolar protein sorting-associated protein 45 [Phytophthora rubi]|uniref:Vacuolar protein sorting-associated protein 45 n=1 Tax=Phytophthora rubi TaxID=129364 RepID=A0A6A3K6M1_9STRA|nr:Vacuolar protein sorting-associated protein 45 [Phytophthora rubi]KAE9006612.1 Vacuolar protein sorting-associated protein 45 [Phytophthora rubi]KAE9323654.1 Vacuolar protein sorting-associated protein 45 [Phytophthora rubi]